MIWIISPVDLPGNTHELAARGSTRAVSSSRYRLSWCAAVTLDDPRAAGLLEVFPADRRPAGPLGLAGKESQEHAALWAGPAAVIEEFMNDPALRVPWDQMQASGLWWDQWPAPDGGWLSLIPAGTWCAGGTGIVSEYDWPGGDGQVIVYEVAGRPSLLSARSQTNEGPGVVPLVTFHCTRCHNQADGHMRVMSACPPDRQAVCQAARRHMQPGRCKGAGAVSRAGEITIGARAYAAAQGWGREIPPGSNPAAVAVAVCQSRPPRSDGYNQSSSCHEVQVAREHTIAWRGVIRP